MNVLANIFVYAGVAAIALSAVAFLAVWVSSIFDRWNKP